MYGEDPYSGAVTSGMPEPRRPSVIHRVQNHLLETQASASIATPGCELHLFVVDFLNTPYKESLTCKYVTFFSRNGRSRYDCMEKVLFISITVASIADLSMEASKPGDTPKRFK